MYLQTFFAALKKIKGRIFSENWSLTFNDTESLMACLRSAQWCLNNDSMEACKTFIDEVRNTESEWSSDPIDPARPRKLIIRAPISGYNRLLQVLPTALTKLLTNMPGHDSSQQDAIFNIINTYIGLGVNLLKNG